MASVVSLGNQLAAGEVMQAQVSVKANRNDCMCIVVDDQAAHSACDAFYHLLDLAEVQVQTANLSMRISDPAFLPCDTNATLTHPGVLDQAGLSKQSV